MYGKLQCNVTFLSSFVWRIKPGTKSHDLKKLKTKSSEHKHELDKNTKTIFTTWGEEVTQGDCRLFSQTGMFFFKKKIKTANRVNVCEVLKIGD